MINTIEIDGVFREYQIERKTTDKIKFKVYPDGSIKVVVPELISDEVIDLKLRNRISWIKKQLDYFSNNLPNEKKDLKNGSTIKYLGKQYRIKTISSVIESIKLKGKFLEISTTKNLFSLDEIVEKWYNEHAYQYYYKTIDKCLIKLSKYGITKPNLSIRKMKNRWGSCHKDKNKVILNSELIKESSLSIQYVILHELCHLKYPNHNNQFYTFFSIVMPDWRQRKQKLENYKL